MITLTIDNQMVQVPEGATILDAAEALGIYIPTMCHLKGFDPSTSCMVCVVKVEGVKSLLPACGALAVDHMHVTTDSDEIRRARKTAIELLLSDHLGDCIGPCQIGCPAGMEIPKMLRYIAAGNDRAAIEVIKRTIPLPAILGRICPAPCEKVCRRAKIDQSVSICRLKRFAADTDLDSAEPLMPPVRCNNNKTVVIVGAGPCGLSAAYYLAQIGVSCMLYDEHESPGGALRYAEIDRTLLPLEIVDKEVQQILKRNVTFMPRQRVGQDISFESLCRQADAVLIATGDSALYDKSCFPLDEKEGKIRINRKTYETSQSGVFAAGGAIGSRRLCVRAVADGREAAEAITAFLDGKARVIEHSFNSRMGLLTAEENHAMMTGVSFETRYESLEPAAGFNESQARAEARRCLHCNCRKADNCRLRDLATAYDVRQNTWRGERKKMTRVISNNKIVYEPGKCIQCGLCIQTARRYAEATGLAFEGRGFTMAVAVPFHQTLSQALTCAGEYCIKNCPTGALTFQTEQELKNNIGVTE